MEIEQQRNKIDAIYELRDAAETKAHAERDLEITGTEAARDALLEAQLNVEARTQEAIDVCHECGQNRADNHEHPLRTRIGERRDNVIAVDFRPAAERA